MSLYLLISINLYIVILNLFTSLINIEDPRLADHETSETIMHFSDGNPAYDYTVPSQPDPTFANATDEGASMDDFFCRPIKIREFEWSSSITAFDTFNPWTEFFTNKRVMNRINNYKLMRCKLHLKFLINGTPFQYGRLMADYIPLRSSTGPPDQLTVDRAFVTQDSVGASQRPHVFLDPTTCSGGTMELPFFWFKDYLDVVNADWTDMGEINIRELNPLKNVHSTSTDTVRITVMAWACDMELAMPTSVNITGLVSQSTPEKKTSGKGKSKIPKKSKKGSDEYPTSGVISGPATAVQNVAGALTKVPFLAPYARASEVAAGAVANIARMFGYSRPVTQTEGISEYRPNYVGSMALTNIPDNTNKLALDVKQETTIDSRTVGLDGTDEMNIKSIAARESYVTKFTWTENDAANAGDLPDDLLWATYVTPLMFDVEPGTGEVETWYHFTPSGYISNLFTSWHGSMTFRFQIVASKFHRGRLRFVYEPNGTLPGIGNSFDEYNTTYSKIVDISEERDVVLNIGHGQDKYWLLADYPGDVAGVNSAPFGTSDATFPALNTERANGVLAVYVLNDLESPDPSVAGLQDIEINVFTSMGDDFEVMDPRGRLLHTMTFFQPQSTPEYDSSIVKKYARRYKDLPVQSLQRIAWKHKVSELVNSAQVPLTLAELDTSLTTLKEEIDIMSKVDLVSYIVWYEITKNWQNQSEPETEAVLSDAVDKDGNEPVNPEPHDMVPTIVMPEYCEILPGEAVKSLRSIIKRYDYHRSESGEDFNVGRWLRFTACDFPHLRGSAPNPISTASAPIVGWNYCNLTVLNYVMAAFSGWRGGVRWKVCTSAITGSNADVVMQVQRTSQNLTYAVDDIISGTVDTYENDALTFTKRNWFGKNAALVAAGGADSSMFNGTAITRSNVNGSLEYELPYYQRLKFVPKRSNYTTDNTYVRYHTVFANDQSLLISDRSYDYYVAAGDDFSGFFFTGLPRVAFVDDPTPTGI